MAEVGDHDAREGRSFRDEGRFFSALVQTPDAALEVFRDGRKLDHELPLEVLAEAREVLDALYAAITGPAEPGATLIHHAFELVFPDKKGVARAPIAVAPPVEVPPPLPSPASGGGSLSPAPVVAPAPVAAPVPVVASPPAVSLGPGGFPPPPPLPTPMALPPVVAAPAPARMPFPPLADPETSPLPAQPPAPPRAATPFHGREEVPEQETTRLVMDLPRAADTPFRSVGQTRPLGPPPQAPGAPIANTPFRTGMMRAIPEASPEDTAHLQIRAAQKQADNRRPATPFAAAILRDAEESGIMPAPVAPNVAPPPAPAVPPARSAVPELTVEQFAALVAECQTYPQQSGAIRQRYGVGDDAAYGSVEQLWRERCSRDPALLQRWHGLYLHYCAWFMNSRAPAGPR